MSTPRARCRLRRGTSAFDSDLLTPPEWTKYKQVTAAIGSRNTTIEQAALAEFTAAMALAISVTFNDGENSWLRTPDGRLRPGPR